MPEPTRVPTANRLCVGTAFLLVMGTSGCSDEYQSDHRFFQQASGAGSSIPIQCVPRVTDPNPDAITADWEKRYWIEKAARKLLAGSELDPTQRETWVEKPREALVQKLLLDPRFGEAALDFNLYFLGYKVDALKDHSGRLAADVYEFPQAINSAKSVLACGDYLSLFDLRQPVFAGATSGPDSAIRPPASLARRTQFIEGLDHYIKRAEKGRTQAHTRTICGDFTQSVGSLGKLLYTMGLPRHLALPTIEWLSNINIACSDERATSKSVAASFRRVRALFQDLTSAVDKIDPESGRNLAQLTPLATRAFGDDQRIVQFVNRSRLDLNNSSTNYNRKRAAYVLDRFFCDDLTPVKLESSAAHKGDAHASDPACIACHYRLDPMAGFFRDFGLGFANYKGAATIVFDDLATMEKNKYDQEWRAPQGSGREWDIGYIRSQDRDSLNVYGSDLEDLFRIVRTAPEARRCLVKRAHEYFIGEDQPIDAGYLDYLTEKFIKASEVNSSRAFRELAATMVLSRAFVKRDLESGACYDFAPGHVANDSPPCKVHHLLETNCGSCHGKALQSGGLDLSRWVRGPDGRMTFPHTPADGRQLNRDATLQRMSDRLSHSDPKVRMPLAGHMSPLARQELYVWVNQMLDPRSK